MVDILSIHHKELCSTTHRQSKLLSKQATQTSICNL